MTIFSNGYRIFKDEEEARNTTLGRIKSSRAIAQRHAHRVSEIQEKTKTERKGIRHIFYYYEWITKDCKEPYSNSFSYLERNI